MFTPIVGYNSLHYTYYSLVQGLASLFSDALSNSVCLRQAYTTVIQNIFRLHTLARQSTSQLSEMEVVRPALVAGSVGCPWQSPRFTRKSSIVTAPQLSLGSLIRAEVNAAKHLAPDSAFNTVILLAR
ncbi:unnamed protein product [Protopolystoma xenopodis]|uniref:Uncharacterized protein n=1 Tax=Protopolystoma xenopodis TaxID=117903 RepID=A0A448X4I0_9PLAT|nr:unnamed protein product [Protopolystoma xenopodis]